MTRLRPQSGCLELQDLQDVSFALCLTFLIGEMKTITVLTWQLWSQRKQENTVLRACVTNRLDSVSATFHLICLCSVGGSYTAEKCARSRLGGEAERQGCVGTHYRITCLSGQGRHASRAPSTGRACRTVT